MIQEAKMTKRRLPILRNVENVSTAYRRHGSLWHWWSIQ